MARPGGTDPERPGARTCRGSASSGWPTGTDERYRVEPGTVVFVDISGFTKLSEGLAKHGKVGAEELTATIGTCFVALLDLAVAYGGRLLKFGGDALLLYFSGDAHEARGLPGRGRDAPGAADGGPADGPGPEGRRCGCRSGCTRGSSTSSWSAAPTVS